MVVRTGVLRSQIRTEQDRTVAPVDGNKDLVPLDDRSGHGLQAGKHVVPVFKTGCVQWREQSGIPPALKAVSAGRRNVRLEPRAHLLEPFFFLAPQREGRSPAVLVYVARMEFRNVVTGPGEDRQVTVDVVVCVFLFFLGVTRDKRHDNGGHTGRCQHPVDVAARDVVVGEA